MKIRNILMCLIIPSFGGVWGGCSSSPSEDAIGQQMVSEAREALQAKHYDEARDSILSLRQNHPTAIEARKQALLLLDSVELFAATDSLQQCSPEDTSRLSLKCEFFRRKIQFDKQNLQK